MIKKKATLSDVKDFGDWLAERVSKGATTYDAQNPTNCLVCQYLKARGKTAVVFEGPSKMFVHNGGKHEVLLPLSIAKIAYGMDGDLKTRSSRGYQPDMHTFRAALERSIDVLEQLRR